MLIGHFGVGLAAKAVAPRVPMALLLPAPLLLDLLWPLFFFAGVERFDVDQEQQGFLALTLQHVPYTHGLVASLGWSLLAGGAWWLVARERRGALVLGALVFSHWALDFLTHTPDLPLHPWSDALVGLGLWRSTAGTLLVEGAIFAACLVAYTRATRPRGRSGIAALWGLVGLLAVVYLHTVFGPPAPSAVAMAVFAMSAWLTPLWGLWLDRSRPLA